MPRKTIRPVIDAFNRRQRAGITNTTSTGDALYLFGNKIAEYREDGLWITDAGWNTTTTRDRLNGLPNVSVNNKNFQLYLNGKEWDGSWVRIGG
jgi:hypothetical protein